jgi:predicted nucleic acid-binding protein
MPLEDARRECKRYSVWQPWVIDQATIESAWETESRYGLHYWDCLVVAAAQHLGCRYLLSEDMGHEQHYGSV